MGSRRESLQLFKAMKLRRRRVSSVCAGNPRIISLETFNKFKEMQNKLKSRRGTVASIAETSKTQEISYKILDDGKVMIFDTKDICEFEVNAADWGQSDWDF